MSTNRVKEIREAAKIIAALSSEELERVLNLNEENVKETPEKLSEKNISHILLRLGIPTHIKGYRYVKKAIMMIAENPTMIESVTKSVYPEIGKEFDTTASRVERAIRHAIEVGMDRGDVEFINEVFGFSFSSNRGRPTNFEFLSAVVEYLRLQ